MMVVAHSSRSAQNIQQSISAKTWALHTKKKMLLLQSNLPLQSKLDFLCLSKYHCRERESHHLYTVFPLTCMPHMRMPMTVRIAAFAYMLHMRMPLTVCIAAFFLLDARACTGLADRLHVIWTEFLKRKFRES